MSCQHQLPFNVQTGVAASYLHRHSLTHSAWALTTPDDKVNAAIQELLARPVRIMPRPAPGHGYACQALQKLLQTLAVYMQMADEPRLGYITDQLKSLSVSSSGPPQLQVGALCLAQYSLDNEWYRAAVQRVISSDPVNPQYAVIFLDFGNTDRVGGKSVRAIDSALAAVPAQAHCCSLAYLKV